MMYICSVSSCIVCLYHACIRTCGIHDSLEQIHARYITDTSRKKYRIRSHFFRLYPLCINTDTSAMQSGYEPLFSDENHWNHMSDTELIHIINTPMHVKTRGYITDTCRYICTGYDTSLYRKRHLSQHELCIELATVLTTVDLHVCTAATYLPTCWQYCIWMNCTLYIATVLQ